MTKKQLTTNSIIAIRTFFVVHILEAHGKEPLCRRLADGKDLLMAKPSVAVRFLFAVRFLVADGKASFCRPPADGNELADGKLANSSSEGGV